MNRNGFTLIEGVVTALLLSIVALYAYKLHTPIVTFFQRGQAHQQTSSGIRTSLDFVTHALESGRPNTVKISNGTGAPNSRIDFSLMSQLPSGTTAYSFYLSSQTLQMQEFNLIRTPAPQTLASNVSSLIFAGDAADPSIVYMTIRIDSPANATGSAISTTQVMNQEIHMEMNP